MDLSNTRSRHTIKTNSKYVLERCNRIKKATFRSFKNAFFFT